MEGTDEDFWVMGERWQPERAKTESPSMCSVPSVFP